MHAGHEELVREIIAQVRERARLRRPVKIRKSGVSHFVPNPYANDVLPTIDVSRLNRLLSLDELSRTCIAEPGLTFATLVEETLKHGLIPAVVPELKHITLGGAISGCSIESTSHRYGGFHDSCLEYELITGDGRLMTCSRQKDADVFEMLHGSYGTLGIISKVTFRLVPAKPFVKMTYEKHGSFDGFFRSMMEHVRSGGRWFIDGIIHGRDDFVLCLGDMTDTPPYLSRYDWVHIYYKSTDSRREDYLAIADYFFRYDAECHWLTRKIPLMENRLVRFLVGRHVLGSKNLIKMMKRLKALTVSARRRPEVIVDVFIPESRFRTFFRWYEEHFDFFPLWIVPYRMPVIYPWVNRSYARGLESNLIIDCAIYGKENNEPDVDYSEVLEKKVTELNGVKTLISRNHYDEETFWRIYNKEEYDRVKLRTDPQGLFQNLYVKFAPRQYLPG